MFDTEQLKIIMDTFSNVANGALAGGVTYLILDFLAKMIPWFIGYKLGIKIIDKVPRISLIKKDK